MQKFFVEKNQINEELNRVIITGTDVNHIKKVLRYKVGQKIEITERENAQSFVCEISKIENEIECNIIEKEQTEKESNIHIHILQGLPKADKMELIIQKCTELGVKEFTPVIMKRCVVKLDSKEEKKKVERWQKIAEAAAKQCGREIIPKINNIDNLKNVYELLKKYDIVLITYEKEEVNTLRKTIENLKAKQVRDLKIAVLIGPEGGIDKQEIETLNEKNTQIVTLGKRILRTETVAFVVTSILMYELRRYRIGGTKMKKKKEGKHAIEDLQKKKKMPKDLKNEQNKAAIKNVAMGIFVTLYFIFLNMGYKNIIKDVYVVDTKVFALVVLVIAIILFEIAFRKGKGEFALYGVEMLLLSAITLFVPYIYYLKPDMTNVIMIILIMSYDVYYVSKATILCAKIQSDYNATLSDIKTIVKKEKMEIEDNDELFMEDVSENSSLVEEKSKKEAKTVKQVETQPKVKKEVEKVSNTKKEDKEPAQKVNKEENKSKTEKEAKVAKTTKVAKTKEVAKVTKKEKMGKDADEIAEEKAAKKPKTAKKAEAPKETKTRKATTKVKKEELKEESVAPSKTTKTQTKTTTKRTETSKTGSKTAKTTKKTTTKPATKSSTAKKTTTRKTTKKEEE